MEKDGNGTDGLQHRDGSTGSEPRIHPLILSSHGYIPRRCEFLESPVRAQCQSCLEVVTTKTKYVTGKLGWLFALVMCLNGLWLGCCYLPLFFNDLRDVLHTCPVCGAQMARYKRLGD